MPPAARVTDMHVCPMVTPGTPPVPHVGGPIIPACSPNVITGFMPQARVTDPCTCVGPLDAIVKGSPTVLVNGLQAARIGDPTVHGGAITTGFPTVLIGEMGSGSVPAGVALVMKPPTSVVCAELAQQLDQLTAAETQAALADATYSEDPDAPPPPPPDGWARATPQDKMDLGLLDEETGEDLTKIDDSAFRADVFTHLDPTTKQKTYSIGFKGTTMTSLEDWKNNLQQGAGTETAYYKQAMDIATTASAAKPGAVQFTGHSLGGGMASAASAVSGAPATVFNPAGLHANTVKGFVDPTGMKVAPVTAYYVDGEVLHAVNDLPIAPDTVGRSVKLRPAKSTTWGDIGAGGLGGAVGGLVGSIPGALFGAAGAYRLARGVRLHGMDAVRPSLAGAAEQVRDQQKANGCT